jgi:hypothetical protein
MRQPENSHCNIQNQVIQVRNSNKQLQNLQGPQSGADHSVGNSTKNNHCATKKKGKES